jgi:hypothetical protein
MSLALLADTVVFDFTAMTATGDFTTKPADGAYCNGMFLEGCQWDAEKMLLIESDPKVLYTDMPVFWQGQDWDNKYRSPRHFIGSNFIHETSGKRRVDDVCYAMIMLRYEWLTWSG